MAAITGLGAAAALCKRHRGWPQSHRREAAVNLDRRNRTLQKGQQQTRTPPGFCGSSSPQVACARVAGWPPSVDPHPKYMQSVGPCPKGPLPPPPALQMQMERGPTGLSRREEQYSGQGPQLPNLLRSSVRLTSWGRGWGLQATSAACSDSGYHRACSGCGGLPSGWEKGPFCGPPPLAFFPGGRQASLAQEYLGLWGAPGLMSGTGTAPPSLRARSLVTSFSHSRRLVPARL